MAFDYVIQLVFERFCMLSGTKALKILKSAMGGCWGIFGVYWKVFYAYSCSQCILQDLVSKTFSNCNGMVYLYKCQKKKVSYIEKVINECFVFVFFFPPIMVLQKMGGTI